MFQSFIHHLGSIIMIPIAFVGSLFSPQSLPPESNRLDISHLEQTVSSLDQRVGNLEGIKNTANLGATLPIPTAVAFFQTSLQNGITSSATSMILVSALDKTGTALASSTYGFVIDEGTSIEENVLADCTGTTCTNMTRGLSPLTGTTTVSALQFAHRRGASVKITNAPYLLILNRIINGQGTIPNVISYTTHPTFTSSTQLVDYSYVNGLVAAGVATSSETNFGGVWLATKAQQAASTDGSPNSPYVLQSKYSTSTYNSSGSNQVVVTGGTNKIDANFISTSSAYTWTGTNTFSAVTTLATSTIASTTISFLNVTSTSTFSGSMFGTNITQQYLGSETITGSPTPKAVMMATSTGKVSMIESDVASTTGPLLGFTINNCALNTLCFVQTDGVVGGFSGLTIGSEYYVSDTAGTISTTVGTSENYVGRAVSASQVEIDKKRPMQYLGAQGIATSATTAINQPWARIAVIRVSSVINASCTEDGATGVVTITKIGNTIGSVGDQCALSGGSDANISTYTWTATGILNALTGATSQGATAYYYK